MEPLNCAEASYDTVNTTGIVGASTIKMNLPPITDEEFPTVSVVVPTYNRQQFFSLILRNWERIDYPREKLELVILDDSDNVTGTGTVPEIFNKPGIRYIVPASGNRMTIGQKRNGLCVLAKHEYIVHMDDDDWYPPESVSARIRILLEYQKSTGGASACFGCTKVLCLDLISNQMFEAFDKSKTGAPATISESTMAYPKVYWEQQQWDNNSKFAECLPFINGRHQTVCTGPSVFIVTQFSHGNNTVERRVDRSSVSEYHAIRFQESLSAYDSQIFNKIRATIIKSLDGYSEAIAFVQKCQALTDKQFKKLIKKTNDQKLLQNPFVIDLMRERMITKTKTSGKDLVYYCGPGDHLKFSNPWNPESKTLGGSEEAVIHLSNEFADQGFDVTVYCVLDGPSKNYKNVKYRNYWEWVPGNLQDVTIIWRDPSNCKHVMETSKHVLLDLHDALDPNWLKGLPSGVKVMVKSHYHKKILDFPEAHVIPNGIHPLIGKAFNKVDNLMVCTSSPDRCVRALLRAMPLIREHVPEAEIHWAYGFKAGVSKGGMEEHHREDVRNWVTETKTLISQTPGFKDLGRLSQKEINELYKKADLFIYPTRFPEIDCISLTKAMSAGAIPIVTPSGAMAEKMGIRSQVASTGKVQSIDSSLEEGEYFNQYVKAIIQTLQNTDKPRKKLTEQANNNYNWKTISSKWISTLEDGEQ